MNSSGFVGTRSFAFVLRIAWIVIRLLLVFWLVKQGSYFYYQGF